MLNEYIYSFITAIYKFSHLLKRVSNTDHIVAIYFLNSYHHLQKYNLAPLDYIKSYYSKFIYSNNTVKKII